MTRPVRSRSPRRSGNRFPRATVTAVTRALRLHDEAELALQVDEAGDAWFRTLGEANVGPMPPALPPAETERLADKLIAASSVLAQDEDPSLGLWAQSAGAALHVLLLAQREDTATLVVKVRSRVGDVAGVTIHARLRRDP
jgi:hypothetical protein